MEAMVLSSKRAHHARRIIWGAALCLLVSSSWAVAQTQQPKTALPSAEKPGTQQQEQPAPPKAPWVVNCINQDAGLVCSAVQFMVYQQGQRPIRVSTAVRLDPKTKKPVLLLQLPLGVYLPSGVTLKFGGGEAKAIAFQSCSTNGCVAEYAITPAEISTLVKGTDLKLSVRTVDKTAFNFDVPAKGFAAAYAKMTGK
jgi:invasion protein IalB